MLQNSFDQEEAKKEGRILPSEGVDEPFDAAKDSLEELERELDEYLREQSRHFGCKVSPTFISHRGCRWSGWVGEG